jgi:signal transduction histidine kinase
LVSNAIKYTKVGAVTIKPYSTSKDTLCIDVTDTGVGIESDMLKDLFSVFTKILEDRELNKSGCGLGLSISKKLSIVLGGDITVRSEKGVGSTFTLTISNLENHLFKPLTLSH